MMRFEEKKKQVGHVVGFLVSMATVDFSVCFPGSDNG